MRVGQEPNCPVAEADKDRIMYAGVPVGDALLMLMDMPSDSPITVGNNINPTISLGDKVEVERLFDELKERGEVILALQKTFFSELYCLVKDRFGVVWHILYYAQEEK